MRLTVEKCTQLSAQDRIDLSKIWQNKYTPSALSASISDKNLLFVARFNERLLAACRVTLSKESALITEFMVREVTRRRGVGHYLLTQCLKAYPHILHWQAQSLPECDKDNVIAHTFLTQYQFIKSTQQPDIYDYFLTESK